MSGIAIGIDPTPRRDALAVVPVRRSPADPARRAARLAAVEEALEGLGRDFKVALDHGDIAKLDFLRPRLRAAGAERRRLRYRR